MPKMRRFLAVMAVAAGAVMGGLAAYAAPMGSLGTLPEAGAAAAVIPVGGHEAMGYECFWSRGCKYCRACAQCYWTLVHCKKRRGHN